MAGSADWSIAVGVLVYLVAIIVAAIYYFRLKKVFIISYVASIATYVFAVFYTWDVFELRKEWILLMLLISTVIMILLGKYFSHVKIKPDKIHTSLKEREN